MSGEVRTKNDGSPYLDMKLQDKEHCFEAKLWDYNPADPLDFSKPGYVEGILTEYQGKPQIKVRLLRNVNEKDVYDLNELIPSAPVEAAKMYFNIKKVVTLFEDSELKKITSEILKRNEEKLMYWPAATGNHHAYRSGLLHHTTMMLSIAQKMCEVYDFVNKDLLYAGVILHDIAKIFEIDASDYGIASEYTKEGNLLGHLVMGAMHIEEVGKEIGISKDTRVKLEHMLLSHHGKREYGAAVLPSFIEAELLSSIDLLDARMFEMVDALKDTEPGEMTGPVRLLDNKRLLKIK